MALRATSLTAHSWRYKSRAYLVQMDAVQFELLDTVVVVVGRLCWMQGRRWRAGNVRMARILVIGRRGADANGRYFVHFVVAAEAQLLAVDGMHKFPQFLIAQRLAQQTKIENGRINQVIASKRLLTFPLSIWTQVTNRKTHNQSKISHQPFILSPTDSCGVDPSTARWQHSTTKFLDLFFFCVQKLTECQ